jgi:diguanylate cyclase (GGDEF)-like protein
MQMNHSDSTFTSQVTVSLVAVGFLAAATVAGISWMASSRLDQVELGKQQAFVRQNLEEQVDAVPQEQERVTVWDDAVVFTRAGDQQWMVKNLGEWMYTYHGHDRVYVLDDKGAPVHTTRSGKTIAPPRYFNDQAAVEELGAKVRGRLAARATDGANAEPLREVAASEVRLIDGRPATVSVKPIIPSTDRVHVMPGREYLHVSVKFLDTKRIVEEVGSQSRLAGMRFEERLRAGRASLPMTGTDGAALGYLTWNAERPGLTLLLALAPGAAFGMLTAGAIALFLAWRLRRSSLSMLASERHARRLAYHDTLTGLPNRALFDHRLNAALESVKLEETEAALLFLDLDRFKSVNDTLGHRAGDELLQQAAGRLLQAVGPDGTVARISGDEFAVLISGDKVLDASTDLAGRLVAALAAPFYLGEESVYVGVSIGIAVSPEAATEREDLLRKADIALYEAKKRGRGCYKAFSSTMDEIVKQRRAIEADLRRAMVQGQGLRLAYQPLYSSDGIMTGAEALLRWSHPVHKDISPPLLITIAEETGQILQLGDWILREACGMARDNDIPWIAVNVSPVQLRDENFAERCLAIIKEVGVSPERIQIEITETVLVDNPELAAATFRKLRAKGILIAIDDFGTGYSSMSYLQDYPVDRLKIDRTFVNALSDGTKGKAIVAAMMEMARALKLDVTAEGVETNDQREMLYELGCREMQGYLFSRPLEAAKFMEILDGKVYTVLPLSA